MINWANDLFFKPRWGNAWYPSYDKLGHFVCHYFAMHLTKLWFLTLEMNVFDKPVGAGGKILLAWVIWAAIGAGYEFVYDRRRGRDPSWKDIIANEIGHFIGAIC